MEKSSKRGKIPQSDWPLIMTRYEAGETLASIARTYDCSPPAISYVVSRSRAKHPDAEAPTKAPGITEPQLLKAASPENAIHNGALPLPRDSSDTAHAPDQPDQGQRTLHPENAAATGAGNASPRRDDAPPREINGFARNGLGERASGLHSAAALPPPQPPHPGNIDQRRTLHLSLGGPPHGNGSGPAAEPQSSERSAAPGRSQTGEPVPPVGGRDGRDAGRLTEPRPASFDASTRPLEGNNPHRKDGSSAFIDRELRARVQNDITAFLAAFDAALLEDTQESRSALREATDRLLRAGARTRIELERLEARLPIPSRDGGRMEPSWRHR
jgi:hypothetical protein